MQVLSFLCILTLLSGVTISSESEAFIDRISVHSGKLNTKILLETDAPLPVQSSSYVTELPATIAVDFECSELSTEPQLKHDGSSLVKDIKIEKGARDNLRLLIDLEEKVPYRIYSSQNTTIVELNSLRNTEGFILDADTGLDTIQLNDLSVSENEETIDITATLSETAFSHVFAINNPLRLVVDMYNTVLASAQADYAINKVGVRRVRSAQFQNGDPHTIARLVFDLDEPKFYTISNEDKKLTVSFYKNVSIEPAPAATDPEPEVTEPELAEESAPQTKELEEAAQQEAFESEVAAQTVSEEKPLPEATPPAAEKLKPAVSEEKFFTELGSSVESSQPEAEQRKKAPEILAEPEADDPEPERIIEAKTDMPVEPPAKVNGNGNAGDHYQEQFTPTTVREEEERYSGEIISMKFKDADLRDVILYLGDFAGLNVVFDPEVRGVVTIDLKDIPWDQALDLILKTNKVGKTLEGNVLRIAPTTVLTREKEEERRLRETKVMAGPMVTKTFTLSYSRGSEVEALLRSKMSERGEIIIDERTNTLIITEVRDRMEVLEKLIDVFDTATPQVSIEARIVEATSTFIRNLGVQWGFKGISDPFYGNQASLKFPNKTLLDGALIPQGIVTKGIGGPLGGYGINLPAPAFTTAVGLSMANVLDTFRIDVALSALETSGEGRIISAPKVTTQNNQEAEIIQGRQIPVQTVANFTVTTRYVNAALELRATPQITAEGTIIMYIEIRNNAADFANLVNGIPPITTQSAQTTVMVPNGGTTVIGGIYRTEDSITRERVPFLHKIPILGNLFKNFARTKQTRELLIFITPRIIR